MSNRIIVSSGGHAIKASNTASGHVIFSPTAYSITYNLTNTTGITMPSRILSGSTAVATFSANAGCELPDSVTVTGAGYVWNKSTGTLTIGNPTGNITVSVVAIEEFKGLCFTANTAGSTVELILHDTTGMAEISNTAYSRNGTDWIDYDITSDPGENVITLDNVGDKVYFRNDINGDFSTSVYMKFVMSGSIAASGNVNSMYSSTEFEELSTLSYIYCYKNLFYGCTSLTTAPSLPATTLINGCYNSMFYGCTSLTTAPVLPATTLTMGCYNSMFFGCTSLTTPPALPATTVLTSSYMNMFCRCSSLATAPALPATNLAPYCYGSMFSSCTSLTTAPVLPAISLALNCYNGMFSDCTSLTTPPALPATTLINGCYGGMFSGCTSLQVFSTPQTSSDLNAWLNAWRIPTSGTFSNTYTQGSMFTNCAGTRGSDDMYGESGNYCVYYTQNEPV